MPKINNGVIILIFILLALIFYISPGFIFCILLTLLLFHLLIKKTPAPDRRFILTVSCAAVILRLINFIIVQYYCVANNILDIFGDAKDNIITGINILNYTIGVSNNSIPLVSVISGRYNTHAQSLLNAIFFFLFGKDIISIKYINILAGALSGWLIYDFTRKIYSPAAGKTAMAVFLFWPTIILWSITDLKESHLILSVLAVLWSIENFISGKGIGKKAVYLAFLAISAGYLTLLKFKFMLPLVSISLGATFIYLALRWCFIRNKKMTKILIFSALIIIICFLLIKAAYVSELFKNYYKVLIAYHRGGLDSGGWIYNLFGDLPEDKFTFLFFIRYFFRGWFHFLLEPLPWHIYSFGLLAVYPMVLIWYAMLFLSAIGMIKLYKNKRADDIFFILVFFAVYVTITGMSLANIGTAVRFRDLIAPFVMIFASCALTKIQDERGLS